MLSLRASFSACLCLLFSSTAFAAVLTFPKNFKWCVSTAAHQIEGGNRNSDWWEWERLPGKIKNGDTTERAADHWNRLQEDTRLIKALKVQKYRLSIEWAKIEPREGAWDWTVASHYLREILLLRKNGIEPLVTLNHFVLPAWVAQKGGWEWEGVPAAFERYTRFVVDLIGKDVEEWVTLNEPTVVIAGGYLAGLIPPGKVDGAAALRALRKMLEAHALAYHAIHESAAAHDRKARVGVAHHLRIFEPYSDASADVAVTKTADRVFNWAFMDAMETGSIRFSLDDLNVNESLEGLANTQDYIGINYYTRDLVELKTKPFNIAFHVKPGSPVTDLGWEIYPHGFYRVIMAAHRRYPKRPIVITENGLADAKDAQRKLFLVTHLKAVHRAISHGAPVEGYCHWSLMDNFEWLEGYAPRFGLYAVDYRTMKRTARPSAKFFTKIVERNRLVTE